MKYFRALVLTLFLCSIHAFSQESNIQHSIVKGETISSIAQKYKVTTASIYKLNPKAKKTLQLNQVILIPNSDIKYSTEIVSTPEKITELKHEVLPKETLYGITKQFKTTPELLYKANPKLETEGLKIGQIITIPATGLSTREIENLSGVQNEEKVAKATPLTHEVQPKESLYIIAKHYGISLKELQDANPTIGKKGLSIRQIIAVPNSNKAAAETILEKVPATPIAEVSVSEIKESVPVVTEIELKEKNTDASGRNANSEIIHEVLLKETKYGIAKKYGITVADLEMLNPASAHRLLVGSNLIIRAANVDANAKTHGPETNEIFQVTEKIETNNNIDNSMLADQLILTASENLGSRYRTGGITKAGFDCSGLMCTTFSTFDIQLPRTSIGQSGFGTKIDSDEAQKGDLIFFKTNGRSRINHVGMVVEVCDGEIKFIHSSVSSGVMISSTREKYYEKNFVQVNRVIQ